MEIFRSYKWEQNYGGEKWAIITETLLQLKQEIDRSHLDSALIICEEVKKLEHNSGQLVPSYNDWQKKEWLKEKWPIYCEY